MNKNPQASHPEQVNELLILGDGNILVHNLTPAMAQLLTSLDPHDLFMRQRAESATNETPFLNQEINLDDAKATL